MLASSILGLTLLTLQSLPPGAFIDTQGELKTLWKIGKGKPMIVIVTKGYWCPTCLAQLAIIDKESIDKLKASVAVVNNDHPDVNAEVKTQLKLPYPLLTDPEAKWLMKRELWDKEGENPIPGILFFDKCGDLVYERKGRTPGDPDFELLFEVMKKIHETKRACTNFT